jgi:putative MATE family efflux protein
MNSNDQKIQMMRNGKVSTALLKMGLPTMIGMLVSALYSIVDAYFAGWLGTSQQAAIAVTFPIIQIIIGLGMTFGTGGGSFIARLLGREDMEGANRAASTAMFTSLFVGIISSIGCLCFLKSLLRGLGATDTILPFAINYAVVYIGLAFFDIFNVTMNNIVTAEGRAKLAMISMILGGGLNVILDPVCMFSLHMGLQGAAVATVFSQAIVSVMFLWYILGKKGTLRFSLRLYTRKWYIFQEIFKVGIPILVYQLLSSVSMGMTSSAASAYGDSSVAAFGDAIRLMTLGTYVVFGFLKGFQPIVGYNYGAKNYDRVRKLVNTTLIWSTIFCVIVAAIMLIFPNQLMCIFTKSDTELIRIGGLSLRANGVIFALFGFEQVAMALFLAMGKGTQGSLLSISRQGLFFIPAMLLLPRIFGLNGIVWVQPIADALTIILAGIFMVKFYRDLHRLSAASMLEKGE